MSRRGCCSKRAVRVYGEIKVRFDGVDYPAVSQRIRRLEKRLLKDKEMRRVLPNIESLDTTPIPLLLI
jgi:hypothetical protein